MLSSLCFRAEGRTVVVNWCFILKSELYWELKMFSTGSLSQQEMVHSRLRLLDILCAEMKASCQVHNQNFLKGTNNKNLSNKQTSSLWQRSDKHPGSFSSKCPATFPPTCAWCHLRSSLVMAEVKQQTTFTRFRLKWDNLFRVTVYTMSHQSQTDKRFQNISEAKNADGLELELLLLLLLMLSDISLSFTLKSANILSED